MFGRPAGRRCNDGAMDPSDRARRLWHGLEHVNAVAYFSAECIDAATTLGLRGFWMGYFGCRAAPLGTVGAGVVEATFYNFHPDRVRRAIPDAWAHASPTAIVDVRAAAAASALRRLLPENGAEQLADVVTEPMRSAVEAADPAGRPLFAANRDLPRPEDPVADLWQTATTLREHRGDGHVALLAGAGLDGCEVHVMACAVATADATDPELYRQSRGWSDDDWDAAQERLASRGLVGNDGRATAAGSALHADIESRTDALAAAPFATLPDDVVDSVLPRLDDAARLVASDLRFPNPMGLPAPN